MRIVDNGIASSALNLPIKMRTGTKTPPPPIPPPAAIAPPINKIRETQISNWFTGNISLCSHKLPFLTLAQIIPAPISSSH